MPQISVAHAPNARFHFGDLLSIKFGAVKLRPCCKSILCKPFASAKVTQTSSADISIIFHSLPKRRRRLAETPVRGGPPVVQHFALQMRFRGLHQKQRQPLPA